MTKDMFAELQDITDRMVLHSGMLFQGRGSVEPSAEGDTRYHLEAKKLGDGFYANMRLGSVHLNVGARTPDDAIRKWVESPIFPSRAYEVNAYESPEAERKREKPLATLRGE